MKEPRVSAAFSFHAEHLLALRADAQKFQLVRHGLEAVCRRDALLDLAGKTFGDFHDFRAARADEMMMVAVVALADEFKPRRAIPKIKTLHHPHLFEQVHGTINRRKVAVSPRKRGENFPVRQRMRMPTQNFQDRRARAGDLVRLPAQTVCQRGQFRSRVRMLVRVRLHVFQNHTDRFQKQAVFWREFVQTIPKRTGEIQPTKKASGCPDAFE